MPKGVVSLDDESFTQCCVTVYSVAVRSVFFCQKDLLPLSHFSLLAGQIINWHILRNNPVVIAIFSLKAWKKDCWIFTVCARYSLTWVSFVVSKMSKLLKHFPSWNCFFVIGFHLQENTSWKSSLSFAAFLTLLQREHINATMQMHRG